MILQCSKACLSMHVRVYGTNVLYVLNYFLLFIFPWLLLVHFHNNSYSFKSSRQHPYTHYKDYYIVKELHCIPNGRTPTFRSQYSDSNDITHGTLTFTNNNVIQGDYRFKTKIVKNIMITKVSHVIINRIFLNKCYMS